jgi:hypothetical protein
MKNKLMIDRMIVVMALMFFLALALLSAPSIAGSWKESFDEICSKAQVADSLSVNELSTLIERSNKLMPEIQAAEDPSKKIYIHRLNKCKALFEFMIESKKGSQK